MPEHTEQNGLFFSKKQLKPFHCTIQSAANGLNITIPGEENSTYTVAYDKIASFKPFPETVKLTISDPTPYSCDDGLCTIELPVDSPVIPAIKNKLKYKGNTYIKASETYHSLSPGVKITFISCAVFFITILYYALIFKSYKAIPYSVDMKIGNRISTEIMNYNKTNLTALEKEFSEFSAQIYTYIYPDEIKPTPAFRLSFLPVLNAVSIPNGDIIFFKEMLRLCEDLDSFTGILCHELSHLEQRHGVRQLLRVTGFSFIIAAIVGGGIEGLEGIEFATEMANLFLTLNYSKSFEKEADTVAIKRMHQASVSVNSFYNTFNTLKKADPLYQLKKNNMEHTVQPSVSTNSNFFSKAFARINTKTNRNRAITAAQKITEALNTHPNFQYRLAQLKKALDNEQIKKTRTWITYQKEYKKLRKKILAKENTIYGSSFLSK
jgi:Zn-dependent protease with chaperone function